MKLLSVIILSVLCTFIQAISLSTIAKVSLTLMSLNKPVSCFFGFFRRRKSPSIQETVAPAEQSPFSFPNQFMPGGGLMNPFGGGGMFFPGFNPGFGTLSPSNRFPPQFKPPAPMRTPQKPPRVPGQPMFPPQQPPIQQNLHQGMQGMPQGMQGMPQGMQQIPQGMAQFPPQGMSPGMDSFEDFNEEGDENDVPGMNTEEAESFFTLLSETDESKCISRLVCEMGANPESGGEFGQTIVDIIGSLTDFPDGSKVAEYNEVLGIGGAEGLSACLSKFSLCDEESYQLVKKSQLDDSQGD